MEISVMKNKHGYVSSPWMASAFGALMIGTLAISTPAHPQQQPTSSVSNLAIAVPAHPQQQSASSVSDVLSEDPRFTTTIQMVYLAGGADRLATAGPLTVFAPTDAAWDHSDAKGLMASMYSTNQAVAFPKPIEITELLRGFFIRGEPTLGQRQDVRMNNVAGRQVEFDPATMTVKWVAPDGSTKSARVSGQPIRATNGIIYPVDALVGD
jgi:uncharacterized surface protein with fasciclin (FAS1) repeats